MSSTLVGLVDQAIQPTDVVSWDANKIGGLPIWLKKPPTDGLLQCDACRKGLSLVTQLYCPLGESAFHRCLYVFVCSDSGCPSHCQFRVFRCLKFDPAYDNSSANDSSHLANLSVNQEMWAMDQDDWGDGNQDDWGEENQDDWGKENQDDWGSDEEGDCVDKGSAWSENKGNIPQSGNTNFGDVLKQNLDAHYPESNAGTISSTNPVLALNNDIGASSQVDSSYNTLHSSVHVELPKAVSQMTISHHEKPHSQGSTTHEQHSPNDLPANPPPPSVSSAPLKKDEVFAEDIGPQSNRYEELAMLLNTKFNEKSKNSTFATQQENVCPVFEPYYLYVIEEPQAKNDELSKHVVGLIKEYEKSEGKQLERLMADGAKFKGKGSGELYEKTELKHGDRMFHKFLKRLQKCPEQCIRYERDGDPLLASELKGDMSVIPPCPYCGAPRIFEVQLLPALIPCLILRGHSNAIEFSTVLIFTCKDNCVPTGVEQDLLEEVAICQEDPDQHLYR